MAEQIFKILVSGESYEPPLGPHVFRFCIQPQGVGPDPFSFIGKTVLRSDKMNMSHFLKEMAEQILMRHQVNGMNA